MGSVDIEKAKALALAQANALAAQQQGKHYEFNGSNVPGYDPATGTVKKDDLLAQQGYGIRETLEGTAGLPGDIGSMIGRGGSALARLLGAEPDAQANVGGTVSKLASAAFNPIGAVLPYDNAVSTQDIQENVTDPLMGKSVDPVSMAGRVARATGNFSAGAFVPGGIGRKALSMILPVAGGEAGAAAAPKGYEDYGRFAGQLIGGAATVPKLGGKPIAEAAKDLGVKTKDMTRVIKRMQQDGMTPQQIQSRLAELGPDATLMDVGPNLRQEGQRIYAQGGRGRGIIDETLTPRDQGANARIRGEIDQNLGPAHPPEQITGSPTNPVGLTGVQRRLGPEYEKVLNNAKAIDTEGVANDIQSAIANERGEAQGALQKVLDMLSIKGTNALDPSPRAALATRHAIDGMIESTADTNVKRVLGAFRRRLDTELTKAAPNIKVVDQKYARLAKQKEAVTRGEAVFKTGDDAVWPQELAGDIAKGGPVIKGRLSQGARAEIERIVGTKANDRVALRNAIGGEGDWNRDKLSQLFGKDKADRIVAVLDRETTFDATSNRVMKNSATAERMPDGGDVFGKLSSWKANGMMGLTRAVLSDIGEAALDKIRSTAAAARDSGVAQIISGTDHNRIVTALIKANGGKALPQDKIEAAVRALLLTSGAKSQSAN